MKRITLALLCAASCALIDAAGKQFGSVVEFSTNKSGSSKDQFNAAIKETDIVVVDFYSHGCGPCRQLAPQFDKIAKENPDVKFMKVNVDTHKEIANMFSIRSIPQVFFFHHGARKDGYVVRGCNPGLVRDYVKKLR